MKTNQHLFAYCLLFICIVFSSCFQVLEDIHFSKDGSGDYKLVLNLSQSRSKIATLINVGKVNGHKIPSEGEINTELKNIILLLKKQSGISNVNGSIDFTNYIGILTLHFSNISNLNTVMQTISSKHNLQLHIPSTYSCSNKILTKKYLYSEKIKKSYLDLGKDKEAFNGAIYTSIFHFENKVEHITNKSAKVSPNNTAVMEKNNISNLLLGTETFTNSITLTK